MTGVATLSFNSCSTDFEEINSNVATIYEVEPERFLYDVQSSTRSSSWEWYYDYYVAQMRWMQYGARRIGNTNTTFQYTNNNIFAQRYSNCFLTTGSYMKHMEYNVNTTIPEAERSQYSNVVEVARITLIYQGLFTSDTQGSLAYTQGWSLRSGGNITEPEFDTQEELYTIWDAELKGSINKLKTNTNQKSFADYDMAFKGDVSKWIKAANAIRLRLALRYMKRDMAKAKAIATEVLSASAELPASTDDSFIFWMDGKYSDNSDYQSVNDLIRASKGFMDYLNKYNDPRRRMFFRINNLTDENLAEWNATNPDNQIPTSLGRWVGGTASFDLLKDKTEMVKYAENTLDPENRALDMQPVNKPQTRIFSGFYDKGSGGTWFPNVTYADFCFMAAEFALEGVTSNKTAEQWYTEGVRSSLQLWNKVGEFCKIHDYAAMTEEEMNTFMAQADIKWNPTKGKEQIYTQTYVEDFKNSNESWALYKRTGFPNSTTSILTLEECKANGTVQTVPRRMRFSYPLEGTANYANEMKKLEEMAKDPNFGDMTNEYGRIWWDIK